MEGTWKKFTNKDDLWKSRPVHAGTDIDGSPTYVARAPSRGPFATHMIPGKLVVREGGKIQFYYCYDGVEYSVDNKYVEFLVDNGYCWETSERRNGDVPANAVVGGIGANNMANYIGRTYHESRVWVPGKIDGQSKRLIAPFGGENKKDEYYVLVKPETESASNAVYNSDSSGGCLKSIGRIFTGCLTGCNINVTNCGFFF